MQDLPPTPPLRASVNELSRHLERIGAAASRLRDLAPQIRHGIPPPALVILAEDLERDLLLASAEIETVHDRAVLELSSLQDAPRSP